MCIQRPKNLLKAPHSRESSEQPTDYSQCHHYLSQFACSTNSLRPIFFQMLERCTQGKRKKERYEAQDKQGISTAGQICIVTRARLA